ncbi:MogA/MoaB family molybdenum cofactor biosynthesis protein [bacterium]|nr:MogA/MoaB family molybdenum cofactor biosynthesis protein [bacterium]
MFKAGIITISDSSYNGKRDDASGPVLRKILEQNKYKIERAVVVPDEEDKIIEQLKLFADDLKLDLILTTGGTGFSPRDITPEATLKVLDKQTPGISESIRAYSLGITKKAMLSRAVSGIRKKSLIINLPGSPKAVKESLEYIIDVLDHALGVLKGTISDCARSF